MSTFGDAPPLVAAISGCLPWAFENLLLNVKMAAWVLVNVDRVTTLCIFDGKARAFSISIGFFEIPVGITPIIPWKHAINTAFDVDDIDVDDIVVSKRLDIVVVFDLDEHLTVRWFWTPARGNPKRNIRAMPEH